MMIRRLVAGFALLLCASAQAAPLRAAAAKVDITPAGAEVLWGFEDRTTPATGTIDPLYARVLVLEAGSQRLALVTLDLGRSFGPGSLDQIREATRKSSGITCLLMAASHTHGAPVVQDVYRNGVPAWEKAAIEKIEAAIETAAQRVLDLREQFPHSTLADLYDPLSMPPALVKAHQALDRAVDAAYGYQGAGTDAARAAFLFGLYQQYTSLLPAPTVPKGRKRRAV